MQINELNEWIEGVNQNLGRLSARLDALDKKVDEFESKTRTSTTTNKSQADRNDADDMIKIVKRICDRQFECANCPLRSSKIGGITCLKNYATNAFNAAAQAAFID